MRSIVVWLVLCSLALAQQAKPGEVDALEVKRWGNRVSEVGGGIRAASDALTSMALQVPVDDSDMWYVTVFGSSKDPATIALVNSFNKDDNLTCFIAKPPGDKKPWAHFNVYYSDDGMQKWRFERFKIAGTPTVVIQPPRNGHFGDPKIVIDKIEGMRSTKELNQRICSSVNLWCKKLAESGYIPPKESVEQFYGESATGVIPDTTPKGGHSQRTTFPWGPDNIPKQPVVNPQFPVNGPAADPTTPTGSTLWDWFNDNPGLMIGILALLKLLEMSFPGTSLVGMVLKAIEGMMSLIPTKQPAVIPAGYTLVKDVSTSKVLEPK